MLRTSRILMSISLLSIGFNTAHAVTYYSLRSQSVNAAREYVGWQRFIHIPDQDKLYGSANVTFEYSRSFRSNDIAECLFRNGITCKDNCGSRIEISGSQAENRGDRDWLAEYFGLPTDFKSTIKVDPVIDNFIVDFNFFLGLDEFVQGLFFRIHMPVVHTRWNLNFSETVHERGTLKGNYPPGYFTSSEVPFNTMLCSFESYMNGEKPTLANDTKFNELCCGRFSTDCGPLKETGVAELQTVLGYSLTQSDDYHVGLGLRVAAPTGTRPDGKHLFEPIVGNGKHWELGGHFTGYYTFWNSVDDHSHASFHVVANVTHMFNASQTRCFDLCGEPNSRYMLAEKLSVPVDNNLKGDDEAAIAQFQKEYAPVANVTQSDVKVSVGVQGDAVFAFTFVSSNMSFDLGYNLWGKTCQKIKLREGCTPDALNGKTWALKGDAFVYGFEDGYLTEPIALSATERFATIHEGTNGSVDGINSKIDNAKLATGDSSDMNANNPLESYTGYQTHTSIQPIFIKEADLDLSGTKSISHKLFAHFSYTWLENEDWTPYLGIGGEVEFGQNECPDCSPIVANVPSACTTKCCDKCIQCTASLWGVWVKGGFSFN